MIDREELKKVISEYKKEFPGRLAPDKEGFKHVAVKCFQDNWDIDAEDFGAMFDKATEKTQNLLGSFRNYPKKMILEFCKVDQEAVRKMFKNLYDENKPLRARFDEFKNESIRIFNLIGSDEWNQDFQSFNSMSTYLWLRFPKQYYIYKYSEFVQVNKVLKAGFTSKKGQFEQVADSIILYDQIADYISSDEELKNLINSELTDEMYPDPEFRTAAIDVGFYISRIYSNEHDWWPPKEEYDPGLSTDDWVNLLNNKEIFTDDRLAILKRWKDFGGTATCKQISEKYGNTAQYYNMSVQQLCNKLAQVLGVDPSTIKGSTFPIIFLGRNADKDVPGVYYWKMRGEVSEALDRVDLSNINLYDETPSKADVNDEEGEHNYYWLVASPKVWAPSGMQIGERVDYTVKNERGRLRQRSSSFQNAKEGDIVFLYEATPVKQIVGLAKVAVASDGEKIVFEKIESFSQPIDLLDFKNLDELSEMPFIKAPMGLTLCDVTPEECDVLMDIIREVNPIESAKQNESYDKERFLESVFMNEGEYDRLAAMLDFKKNVILCGAPGVGKTFAAKRLAYSLMGEKDDSRIGFVQFHQNYSYEDFVLGYKPTEDGGFKLEEGVFYRFCRKAVSNPDNKYFFIIDEINRGNLSKIFGELLMAIEDDYRGMPIKLAYGDRELTIPRNLYIIGMMNTADRSLALMDYALRRRFGFFEMKPAFEEPIPESWKKYQDGLNNELFNEVIEKIKELNKDIRRDESLGDGFLIGHSHFSNIKEVSPEMLQNEIDFSILPTLKEYWFDNKEKYEEWEGNLSEVF